MFHHSAAPNEEEEQSGVKYQRNSVSTSTAHCSSGRAVSWLPVVVRFQGITQTHHYSHTSGPSRCDLPRPGSEILTTADRNREAFNPRATSDRLDGGDRLGGVGLFQALVQPRSGASRHQGADYLDVMKDIVKNRDMGRLWLFKRTSFQCRFVRCCIRSV